MTRKDNAKGKKWSKEEINFLLDNANKKTIAELSKDLNRTKQAVHMKIRSLGISTDYRKKKSKYITKE